jgi:hypothetical protein
MVWLYKTILPKERRSTQKWHTYLVVETPHEFLLVEEGDAGLILQYSIFWEDLECWNESIFPWRRKCILSDKSFATTADFYEFLADELELQATGEGLGEEEEEIPFAQRIFNDLAGTQYHGELQAL